MTSVDIRPDQARIAMCQGKKRFNSFSLAEKVGKRARRKHDDANLQVYRCRFCAGYHPGNHPKGKGW